jgi:hypothetical protein
VIQVHLLDFLHLMALGIAFAMIYLVTLGGCRHLDSLEQRDR